MAVPTLEGLPTELRIQVLCEVPDRDTLISLVLASCAYHGSYITARKDILQFLVKRQFDGFLDINEALTAVRSENLHFTLQREKAISLLDKWRRRDEIRELHQSRSPNPIDEPADLGEIMKLFRFHKVLRFFLEDFSINAPRPPWIQPAQWKMHYLPLRLSFTERRRVVRALCRLQILQNIFGEPIKEMDHWKSPRITKYWHMDETHESEDFQEDDEYMMPEERGYRLFYGTMLPWAHHEMGSVHQYFISKVEVIMNGIAERLRQLSKSTPCEFFWDILPVEERPPSACEIEIESDLVHLHQHFRGLAGLGPELLYEILHMDRKPQRDSICTQTRGFWSGPFIGYDAGSHWASFFPLTDPADHLEGPNFEEVWSTLPLHEQPNLAWKKAWVRPHDKEEDFETSVIDRNTETDWEWCYAIWDDSRLKEWKAPLLEDCS